MKARDLRAIPALFLVLLLASLGLSAQEADKRAGNQPQLDSTHYRLKIEPILEPTGKVAIYRVQIWTRDERKVYLHSNGGQLTQEGLFRRNAGDELFRADFVLLACLREPRDLDKRGAKCQLEFRYLVGGAPGMTVVTEDADSSLQLSRVLEFRPLNGIHKVTEKTAIGRFRGKLLEVEVK